MNTTLYLGNILKSVRQCHITDVSEEFACIRKCYFLPFKDTSFMCRLSTTTVQYIPVNLFYLDTQKSGLESSLLGYWDILFLVKFTLLLVILLSFINRNYYRIIIKDFIIYYFKSAITQIKLVIYSIKYFNVIYRYELRHCALQLKIS